MYAIRSYYGIEIVDDGPLHLLPGIDGEVGTDRREKIVKLQVGKPHEPRLSLEVAAPLGERFLHGPDERVQGLLRKASLGGGLVEIHRPAPAGIHGMIRALNAVDASRHGQLDAPAALDFLIERLFPYPAVRVVGKAPKLDEGLPLSGRLVPNAGSRGSQLFLQTPPGVRNNFV